MSTKLPAFKAYDIRGRLPHEINPRIAYQIGRGLARVTGARTAVLGMDSRLTSPELLAAVAAGLAAEGVAVASLGLCGTEEVYHATGAHGYDLGAMITASHNPADYNGLKMLRKGGLPFSHDVDMPALEAFVRENLEAPVPAAGDWVAPTPASHRDSYVQHILSLVDVGAIRPAKIVIHAGNGAAGPTADAILAKLPMLEVVRVHHEPDGHFPNGIPNPLLPENRAAASRAVIDSGAALGVAWDGDFDRCFLYDGQGRFVSCYYLCALLARTLLQKEKSAIVHDPRLYWDTVDTITAHGGTPHICKVGHGYYKPMMRSLNAVFGGEISGHFYFRDFYFCDTGMLPWLLVLELMGRTGKTLADLVAEHAARAPASDEINFRTAVPAPQILDALKGRYQAEGAVLESVDGLGFSFEGWRANVRSSSNEPLLRLNVEARNQPELDARLAELTRFIEEQGAEQANH